MDDRRFRIVLWGRLRIAAQPYNDHIPFIPFRVEYWKVCFFLKVFGRERYIGHYVRFSRAAGEIRKGLYAPHPWANCYDSRSWTG